MLIDVNEMLSAFSLALDLAENKTFEHAQRTAYIALRVAREIGVSNDQLKDIHAAALLHDIGLVNALADIHTDESLLVKHCIAGKEISGSLPLSPNVSEYILWHHANWDGSGPFELMGNEIPRGAQIVYLADQLDLMLKSQDNGCVDRYMILDYLNSTSGKTYSPIVVEAFIKVQEREVFWLDYNHYNMSEVLSRIQPVSETKINLAGLEDVAFAFAKIIDSKSPFTHDHSQGVLSLLSKLGEYYGFDEETTKMLTVSGLLHDLGKLAVPNHILDKPGKLISSEFQIIKSHPYYTKLILSRVKDFVEIKEWAGNHHETLDGKGYPEGLRKEQLSRQDQMIAICDIYQALTEERPYRKPLAHSKVYEIMGELVRDGKLSPEIFSDLRRIIGLQAAVV